MIDAGPSCSSRETGQCRLRYRRQSTGPSASASLYFRSFLRSQEDYFLRRRLSCRRFCQGSESPSGQFSPSRPATTRPRSPRHNGASRMWPTSSPTTGQASSRRPKPLKSSRRQIRSEAEPLMTWTVPLWWTRFCGSWSGCGRPTARRTGRSWSDPSAHFRFSRSIRTRTGRGDVKPLRAGRPSIRLSSFEARFHSQVLPFFPSRSAGAH